MIATGIEPVVVNMHETPPERGYSIVRLRTADGGLIAGWVPRVDLFAGPLRDANLSRRIIGVPQGVIVNMIKGNSR